MATARKRGGRHGHRDATLILITYLHGLRVAEACALREQDPPILPSAERMTSAPGTSFPFAAQWLAYALPYRRFAHALTGADARLGAGVDRYSFTAVDFHHLLPAGLPAHTP